MNDCWYYAGYIDEQGYGMLFADGKRTRMHRISYENYKGAIPDGLVIDHLCRNRSCMNPEHLEAVTARVNTLRGYHPTANNARKTHCPKGHIYDVVRKKGSRRCNTCDRKAWREYTKRKYAKFIAETQGREVNNYKTATKD